MSLYRLNTSGAGAALPAEVLLAATCFAGDRVIVRLLSESGVAAANAQRPTLVYRPAEAENVLLRSPDPGAAAPPAPFVRYAGFPAWQIDADAATPFVCPVDGAVSIRATTAGIWTYDVQVLRGPDRDRIAADQAPPFPLAADAPESVLALALAQNVAAREVIRPRVYPLTVVEGLTTFATADLPTGVRRFRVLSDGLPVSVDRVFGATTRTQAVATNDVVEIGSCAQFTLRSAGVVSLVFEVEA